MCIDHIFLIHSPIDGQPACFHFLAVVNSAAGNIDVYKKKKISVLGRLGMVCLGHIVIPFLGLLLFVVCFRNLLCWLVFANLTQTKVIWEEGTFN